MDEFNIVSRKAADLLARRPHFRKELEQKLLRKGYDERIIAKVLDSFEEKGFINDNDRAGLYAEELKRKRYGKYEAVRKLIERGFDEHNAKKVVGTFFLENDERENIMKKESEKILELREKNAGNKQ